MTHKTDFKKSLDAYRAEQGEFRIVEVPDLQYLMIDGRGDPNTSPAFAEAVASLYPVAYKLKFASKRDLGRDYVVPPLEGLWWAEDMASFTAARFILPREVRGMSSSTHQRDGILCSAISETIREWSARTVSSV